MNKKLEALEVWYLVEKYLNAYHHQAVNEKINVETVEGYPISIIEDSLKALEIIKEKKWLVEDILNAFIEDKEKYDFLKEILGNER